MQTLERVSTCPECGETRQAITCVSMETAFGPEARWTYACPCSRVWDDRVGPDGFFHAGFPA